jgi:hypothetical protein
MEREWEVIRDTMATFQTYIRLRSPEWTLHSWHPFIEVCGGGRVSPYEEQMICSVWWRAK